MTTDIKDPEIGWRMLVDRVAPGTKVSSWKGEVFEINEETWEEYAYFGGGRCGILLSFEVEHFLYMPDYLTGEPVEAAFLPSILVQPFDFAETVEFYDPTDLHYFLNDQWLRFEEVLKLVWDT